MVHSEKLCENADLSNLTWRDHEASMVISDDSFMIRVDRRILFWNLEKT